MTMEPEQDNIEVAMTRVAKNVKQSVASIAKDDDEAPADKQILIRIHDADRERWKLAADRVGLSMSQFIRDTVNDKVGNLLDCQHPINFRRYYPWAEFCLKCETRLRG